MSERPEYHDPSRAYEGYTLFSYIYKEPSDQAAIYLVDMDGEIVHTWDVDTALQSYCKLLSNGNLVYPTRDRTDIQEAGIRELDPNSDVVWSYHCRIDHDMQIVGTHDHGSPHIPDDHLLLHTVTDHMVPKIAPELVRNPYIVEIDREKNLHWEWYGEDHFEELKELLPPDQWEYVRNRIDTEYPFDWAHNNTLQLIPENETYRTELEAGEDARFAPGNIVFSYRSIDVIGVIEYPSGDIVWAWGPDELDGQHLPHVLENGNLLIFDNGTERGWSRVIEVDPLSEDIVWEYTSDPKDDFYSPAISGAQRLPNGNTLICSGNQQWLFEVTPSGDIVWEFDHPFTEANDESDMDMIYRCRRYPREYCEPLLERL
ncbi:aryl-sulfate sulfotransferase [Natrialbaceae archaeon A-CW3]